MINTSLTVQEMIKLTQRATSCLGLLASSQAEVIIKLRDFLRVVEAGGGEHAAEAGRLLRETSPT